MNFTSIKKFWVNYRNALSFAPHLFNSFQFSHSSKPHGPTTNTTPVTYLYGPIRSEQSSVRPTLHCYSTQPTCTFLLTSPNRILISFMILFSDKDTQYHTPVTSRRIAVRASHFLQHIHINILSVRTSHLLQHIHINISSVRTYHLLLQHIFSQNILLVTKTYKHRTHCQSGPTTCR